MHDDTRQARHAAPTAGSRSDAEMRLITTAVIVSALGTWSYNVAIAVYAYQVTQSTAWVAAATVGRYVPALFLATWGSRVTAHLPRRSVVIASDLICAFVMVALTFVVATGGSLVLAIALAAISSGVARVQASATLSLAADVVVESRLVRTMAMISTSEAVATAVGPALASALLLVAAPQWLFLLNAISFAVSAALLSGVADRRRSATSASAKVASVGTRRTVRATVWPLLATRTIAAVIYGADIVLLAVIATEGSASDTGAYGWLLGAAGVGGLIAALGLRRWNDGQGITIPTTIGMVIYALPLVALAYAQSLAPELATQVVRGVGCVLVVTLVITALQRAVPSELSQEVFGQTHSLVLVGTVVGSVMAPVLLSWLGLTSTLWVLAVLPVFVQLALVARLRRLDGTTTLLAEVLDPVVSTLRGLTLFRDASRWTLIEIADGLQPLGIRAGEPVVTEGEAADALYVLVEGEVEVTAAGPEGPVVLRRMAGPTYFGEIGVLRRVPRTATVTAVGQCTVWRVPAQVFLNAAAQAGVSSALSDNVVVRLGTTGRPASETT